MFPKIVQKNVKASFRKFSLTIISIMITKKNIYLRKYLSVGIPINKNPRTKKQKQKISVFPK